tara:strand:+ start:6491 stop:7561 length:1071 start_codon:yes stop_codon:yes gene_type:complete
MSSLYFNVVDECITLLSRDHFSSVVIDKFLSIKSTLDQEVADFDPRIITYNQGFDSLKTADLNAQYLANWNKGDAISLPALAIVACDQFAISSEILKRAIIGISFIAEVNPNAPTCAPEFHGVLHFKKVVLQCLRLISYVQNSDVFETLSEHDLALLLIGAITHDLGHNGKSNNTDIGHFAGEIEQTSFDLTKKYLFSLGLDDDDFLEKLNIILLTTDVSSREGPSYCTQMRQCYAYHHGSEHNIPALDEKISRLKDDKVLNIIACLLHEADIATSSGISFKTSIVESRLLANETGMNSIATPAGLLFFLENEAMCGSSMNSVAGKALYDEPMRLIIDHAHKLMDEGQGKVEFPSL